MREMHCGRHKRSYAKGHKAKGVRGKGFDSIAYIGFAASNGEGVIVGFCIVHELESGYYENKKNIEELYLYDQTRCSSR